DSDGVTGDSPADYARAFARLENHYFYHGGFLGEEQQILHPNQMAKIADVPGVIVQGRYDMICPPVSAHKLSQAWPKSRLTFIGRAGHALSEPGISTELVRTMDMLAAQRHSLGL
ncbi:MAG: prolyl aminopeptidase, partial [Pseudomonadota bacterium]